jgi:hypothetical protein
MISRNRAKTKPVHEQADSLPQSAARVRILDSFGVRDSGVHS